MDTMAKSNPSLVSTYVAGKAYENRNIRVLKIKATTTTSSSKRKVWLDCGIHAVWIEFICIKFFISKN